MVMTARFNEKMYHGYNNFVGSRKFQTNYAHDTPSPVQDNTAMMPSEFQQNTPYQPNFNQSNFVNNPNLCSQDNWTGEYVDATHCSRYTHSGEQFSCNYFNPSTSAPYNSGNAEGYLGSSNDGYCNSHSPLDCTFRPEPCSSFEDQQTPFQTGVQKIKPKEKYRVVYTDYQKKQLEKEFHDSKYINIQTKVELAGKLGLTQRQIKIWFQNRRAKERKQAKKLQLQQQQQQEEIKNQQIQSFGPRLQRSTFNHTNYDMGVQSDIKKELEAHWQVPSATVYF